MSILVNRATRVLVQGFTGKQGAFHAEQAIAYGTQIVGGITPGRGGEKHLDRPIFNTVAEGVAATGADASMIFVPPPFAADAICEAADAGIKVIACITEGIPVLDMLRVKASLAARPEVRLIGPNCQASSPRANARSASCRVPFTSPAALASCRAPAH